MKKILISILIFIIIFNFATCNFSYATEAVYTEEAFSEAEEGKATGPNGSKVQIDQASTPSSHGAIIGILAAVVDIIPMMLNKFMDYMARQGGYVDFNTSMDGVTEEDFKWMTIEKIVFGNYYLLNADVFQDSTQLKVSLKPDGSVGSSGLINSLDAVRDSVNTWYAIIRIIALSLGLITLLYIGIRMAMSSVATEQAKYKKMLIAWVQSILIIALLPYIMILINYAGSLLMNIIKAIKTSLINSGDVSFETTIIELIYGNLENCGGMTLAVYSILFWILIFTQFKFFIMYIKRFLAVSFLVIISPLITITYSIDKAGDGKAQAFGEWFKEYFVNIMIQPLQAILYLIFVFSANEIAIKAPVVGIIFLLSLTRAEKIVKTIFNLRELSSISTLKIFNKK